MSYTKADDVKYNDSLKARIAELKKEKDAIIIVHNYQRDEVQDIADIAGDSLGLSRAAIDTDAKLIIFCGVSFMAETASILNPNKKVILPVKEAGCPMADMITPDKLNAMRQKHPGAVVVCYVNSTASIKAVSDICCTSANAINVCKSLKEKEIIFVPDRNLGLYVQSQLPEKKIIPWEGYCPTHIRLQPEDVVNIKKEHPKALFLAHPECNPDVLEIADHITSTGGMIKYVEASKEKEFIIGTEMGLLYALKKHCPDKKFYLPTENLVCPSMKLTTLGWVAHALEMEEHEVKVPDDLAKKARIPLQRMLEVTGEAEGAALSGV